MYYEIPGYQTIKALYLEDDSLSIADGRRFYYEKIKDPRITNYSFFSPYAILEFTYEGEHVTLPFSSRGKHNLESAYREVKNRMASQGRSASSEAQVAQDPAQASASATATGQPSAATVPVSNDMVRQLEDLKKLLDEGILTQEEFTAKKRQILGL